MNNHGNRTDFIITKEGDPVLFRVFSRISYSMIILVSFSTIFSCIAPIETIRNLNRIGIIFNTWNYFSASKINYAYFEEINLGLGERYAFSFSLSFYILLMCILSVFVGFLITRSTEMKPLKGGRCSTLFFLIFSSLLIFVLIFYDSFKPYENSSGNVAFQSLFDTEWSIITISIFFIFEYTALAFLLIALLKFIYFTGEIDRG